MQTLKIHTDISTKKKNQTTGYDANCVIVLHLSADSHFSHKRGMIIFHSEIENTTSLWSSMH